MDRFRVHAVGAEHNRWEAYLMSVPEFATQTRPEMKRGTGILRSIRDEGEQFTGSIHTPSAPATDSPR